MKIFNPRARMGGKILVAITTGEDVESITVNGVSVTRYSVDKRTGERIFRIQLPADTLGEQELEVVCYDSQGQAGETLTRTVRVDEAHAKLGELVADLLARVIGCLLSRWS
jgi:hypothetical protein